MSRQSLQYSIGIDVGKNDTHVVLVSQQGYLLQTIKLPTSEAIVNQLLAAIMQLTSEHDIPLDAIASIRIVTSMLLDVMDDDWGDRKLLILRLTAAAVTMPPVDLGWDPLLQARLFAGCCHDIESDDLAAWMPVLEKAQQENNFSVVVIQAEESQDFSKEIVLQSYIKAFDPRFQVSLSHQLQQCGVSNRQNAAIIDALLSSSPVYRHLHDSLMSALAKHGLDSITCWPDNRGLSLHSHTLARVYANVACGLRAAGTLAKKSTAIVLDIGMHDIKAGLLHDGEPVLEHMPLPMGANSSASCQLIRPWLLLESLGLATLVQVDPESHRVNIGPQMLTKDELNQAMCHGGDRLSLLDVAIALRRINIGSSINNEKLGMLLAAQYPDDSEQILAAIDERIHLRLLDFLRQVIAIMPQTCNSIILVGHGAALFDVAMLPTYLDGRFQLLIPDHAAAVAAIGAANLMVSVQVSRHYDDKQSTHCEVLAHLAHDTILDLLSKEVEMSSIRVSQYGLQQHHQKLQLTLVGMRSVITPSHYEVREIFEQVLLLLHSLGVEPLRAWLRRVLKTKLPQLSSEHFPVTIKHDTTAPIPWLLDKRPLVWEDLSAVTLLDQKAIAQIAVGAGFFAAGAYGHAIAKLYAQTLLQQDYSIAVVQLSDLKEDQHVVVVGDIASGSKKMATFPSIQKGVELLHQMQHSLGKSIDAIVSLEAGGFNALYSLCVAAACGIPVVDADCKGRSIAGLFKVVQPQNTSPDFFKAVVFEQGQVQQLSVNDLLELEERVHTRGPIVYMPMTAAAAKSCCIPRSVSRLQQLGAVLDDPRLMKQQKLDKIDAVLTAVGYSDMQVVMQARVINLMRQCRDGFDIGVALLQSQFDADKSELFELAFQDGYLFLQARYSQRYAARLPEMLLLLDSKTLSPISCVELCVGDNCTVIKIQAPSIMQQQSDWAAYNKHAMQQLLGNMRGPLAVGVATVSYHRDDLQHALSHLSGQSRIALLVSMGQDYYEDSDCQAIIKHLTWLQQHAFGVTADIVLADTLQIFNVTDPYQLNVSVDASSAHWYDPAKQEGWRVCEVAHNELQHQHIGDIRYVVTAEDELGREIEVYGVFGGYSFIYNADDVQLAAKKRLHKHFSAKMTLPCELFRDEQQLLLGILQQVARQAGDKWLLRNTSDCQLRTRRWDEWHVDPATEDYYATCMRDDKVFQLLVMRKIAVFKKNRCGHEESAFWRRFLDSIEYEEVTAERKTRDWHTTLQNNLLLPLVADPSGCNDAVFNAQVAAVLSQVQKSGGYFHHIKRYILSETAILMQIFAKEYTHIFYNGNEPLFIYLYYKLHRQVPRWVSYTVKNVDEFQWRKRKELHELDVMRTVSGGDACYIPPSFALRQVRSGFSLRQSNHLSYLESSVASALSNEERDPLASPAITSQHNFESMLLGSSGLQTLYYDNTVVSLQQLESLITDKSSMRVFIYAEPGRGKSTLTRRLAKNFSTQFDFVFLITPNDFKRMKHCQDIASLLQFFYKVDAQTEETIDFWLNRLRQQSCLFLIDAYDQYVDKQRLDHLIASIVKECAKAHMVVTSDNSQVRPDERVIGFMLSLEIKEFSNADVIAYFNQMVGLSADQLSETYREITHAPGLLDIAKNPLLSSIIVYLLQQKQVTGKYQYVGLTSLSIVFERLFYSFFDNLFREERCTRPRILFMPSSLAESSQAHAEPAYYHLRKIKEKRKRLRVAVVDDRDEEIVADLSDAKISSLQTEHHDNNRLPAVVVAYEPHLQRFYFAGQSVVCKRKAEQTFPDYLNAVVDVLQKKMISGNVQHDVCIATLAEQFYLAHQSGEETVAEAALNDHFCLNLLDYIRVLELNDSQRYQLHEIFRKYFLAYHLFGHQALLADFIKQFSTHHARYHLLWRLLAEMFACHYRPGDETAIIEFFSCLASTLNHADSLYYFLLTQHHLLINMLQTADTMSLQQALIDLTQHHCQPFIVKRKVGLFIRAASLACQLGNLQVLQQVMGIALAPGAFTEDNDALFIDPEVDKAAKPNLLHMACYYGQRHLAQWLYQRFPRLLSQRSNNGINVWHWACGGGDLQVTEWLLQVAGGLLQQPAYDGHSALHVACYKGRLPMVRWLLDHTEGLLAIIRRDGGTVLHTACFRGNLDVVCWLVKFAPKQIKARNHQGMNVLHAACREGHLNVVEWLIDYDPALLLQTDISKRSAWQIAQSKSHHHVLELLTHKARQMLLNAIRVGDANVVSTVLHLNATLAATLIEESKTLLHYACSVGDVEMVSLLLQQVPQLLQSTDADNATALHIACVRSDLGTAQLLIRQGIHVSIEDVHGKTAEAYAKERGDESLCALFTT